MYYLEQMKEHEEPLVVLETFASVPMAGIAKSKLDAYGIPCILTDETATVLYPLPFTGVRLQVLASDAEEARRILEEEN